MRDEFLPFSLPSLGEDELDAVADTLRSGWITAGPRTADFEREFAANVGAPATLALNSCTAALHTALVALGLAPGDEVVTTPMTFASTVNAIEHVGATPVLVDVEADTLNVDARLVERVISAQSRAVLPVHYGGHPADLDAIQQVVAGHSLEMIEDAAHAFPAMYKGRPIGSGPNPVAFSFYATKNLTTGEGGMLTGDPDFIDRARKISLHGMSRDAWDRYDSHGSWFYEVTLPGWKYNMSDIQAAMGLAQLRKIPAFQGRRRGIVHAYSVAFDDHASLELPTERPDVEHAWHLYVLRLRLDTLTIGRDRFIDEMKARNIGTSVHFIPIHLHPFYRDKYGYKPTDFPVAYDSYQRMLSLPLTPALDDQDVSDVIEAVLDVCATFKR